LREAAQRALALRRARCKEGLIVSAELVQ